MYVLLLFTQADTLPFDVPGPVEIFSQDSTESDPEDNIPLIMLRSISNTGESSTKKGKIAEKEPNWTDEIIDITMNQGNGYLAREDIVKQELAGLNPFQIFEKLFDDEIITYITKETQRYAAQQNNHSFTVTNNEIKIFIGFLLFTGYHRLLREKLYWCTDEDLNIPLVRGSMSRNKYYEIKKYFHLANNETVDKNDKVYKIRSLMEKLNKRFLQWGIFHDKLSIDEAMVKYFGHHSSKQFIRGKPVRLGYKDWMICSSSGYCYQFDTYCGAKQNRNGTDKNLPLGSKVVLDLLEIVTEPQDHIIFFDNYFTSHGLLKTLRDLGYRTTGTVRDNRTKNVLCLISSNGKKKIAIFFSTNTIKNIHYF
ncbi:transposase is4 [Holotrichia oblita]|uniref:Transposase is4 n=1 Tax=Holotrichia oblita TaxID=644536 RepID=A0ACB9T6M6_HOLOL|nr:transposase is4 [Holotrichia oblita]